MDWTLVIAAGIAAVPGTLALIAQARVHKANSKKADAEAADVQVGTSLDLMREMRADIVDLKSQVVKFTKRLSRVELENSWLRNGVGVLIHQLECHNISPEFTLDSIPKAEED